MFVAGVIFGNLVVWPEGQTQCEPRARRGGSVGKRKLGCGQGERSKEKGAGVNADTDGSMGGGVGGGGRSTGNNIGLGTGREERLLLVMSIVN